MLLTPQSTNVFDRRATLQASFFLSGTISPYIRRIFGLCRNRIVALYRLIDIATSNGPLQDDSKTGERRYRRLQIPLLTQWVGVPKFWKSKSGIKSNEWQKFVSCHSAWTLLSALYMLQGSLR